MVYTAVTDPVAAELSDEDGKPVGEVTGTSDKLPIKQQLEMMREMLPDAKKLGIQIVYQEVDMALLSTLSVAEEHCTERYGHG